MNTGPYYPGVIVCFRGLKGKFTVEYSEWLLLVSDCCYTLMIYAIDKWTKVRVIRPSSEVVWHEDPTTKIPILDAYKKSREAVDGFVMQVTR